MDAGSPPKPQLGAPQRKDPGDGLFSREATLSVSSALESLTSVFGMGTGVASPLESPGSVRVFTRPAALQGPIHTREEGRRSSLFASFCCMCAPRALVTILAIPAAHGWVAERGQALDH